MLIWICLLTVEVSVCHFVRGVLIIDQSVAFISKENFQSILQKKKENKKTQERNLIEMQKYVFMSNFHYFEFLFKRCYIFHYFKV